MPDYDLVIRGGTVVTASDTYRADIGIRGGRIAAIGDRLPGTAVAGTVAGAFAGAFAAAGAAAGRARGTGLGAVLPDAFAGVAFTGAAFAGAGAGAGTGAGFAGAGAGTGAAALFSLRPKRRKRLPVAMTTP